MKLAFISGGSRGLGAALLECYRQKKYNVTEFSRTGRSKNSVHMDFSYVQSVLSAPQSEFWKYRTKDISEIICFNNAGVLPPIGIASNKDTAEVLDNININFTGAILFLNEFLGYFQTVPCRKTIVNISSGAALRGIKGWSLYCAAKAGLDNFIRAIALEQKAMPYPIKAISIDPGMMDTTMQKRLRETEYSVPGFLEKPEIVAEKIAALVSGQIEGGDRYHV